MPDFTRTPSRSSSLAPGKAVHAACLDAPRIESPVAGSGSPPKLDLTSTRVIAGAGAAATSAVMGSFLGATGTVAGAALGSVVSTVGASVYQLYLDRTRETVRAHVRLPGGRSVAVTEQVEIPAPRSTRQVGSAPARVVVTPADAASGAPGDDVAAAGAGVPAAGTGSPRRRPLRRWAPVVAAAVLAFVLAMLAVTGAEWLKGSTLTSGQPGTSVGRVLDPGPPATAEPGPASDSTSDAGDGPGGAARSPEPTVPADERPGGSTKPAPEESATPGDEPAPTTATPIPPIDLLPGR